MTVRVKEPRDAMTIEAVLSRALALRAKNRRLSPKEAVLRALPSDLKSLLQHDSDTVREAVARSLSQQMGRAASHRRHLASRALLDDASQRLSGAVNWDVGTQVEATVAGIKALLGQVTYFFEGQHHSLLTLPPDGYKHLRDCDAQRMVTLGKHHEFCSLAYGLMVEHDVKTIADLPTTALVSIGVAWKGAVG